MHLTPLETFVTLSTVLELNPLFQAVKCMKLKSAKDISPMTFGTILAIGALWLVYGISIHNIPLIVGNTLKLISATAVIIAYIKYRGQ
ncbi:MAG: hypothetical protein JO019_00010 [Candidatus Kaiserbacteria bacterium]|nr:hypothetical protein [Candidatus Kaiserbacteria bacterium]